jgi:hypothetical protein
MRRWLARYQTLVVVVLWFLLVVLAFAWLLPRAHMEGRMIPLKRTGQARARPV